MGDGVSKGEKSRPAPNVEGALDARTPDVDAEGTTDFTMAASWATWAWRATNVCSVAATRAASAANAGELVSPSSLRTLTDGGPGVTDCDCAALLEGFAVRAAVAAAASTSGRDGSVVGATGAAVNGCVISDNGVCVQMRTVSSASLDKVCRRWWSGPV